MQSCPLGFCEELLWELENKEQTVFLGQQGSIELEQFGSENAKVEQTAAHHITPEGMYNSQGCLAFDPSVNEQE